MEMGTITCEWETEELVIVLVILLSEVIGTALENITIILKNYKFFFPFYSVFVLLLS